MRTTWGLMIGGLLGLASLAASQSAAPPTCDSQLQEQYQQLVATQLVPAPTPSPDTPPLAPLAAITMQLRVVTLQYYEKAQQALSAEGQAARLRIELQQLRQQVQGLTAELENHKQTK